MYLKNKVLIEILQCEFDGMEVFNEKSLEVHNIENALPEKLSDYWINKLENEVRSRKYSLKTKKRVFISKQKIGCFRDS